MVVCKFLVPGRAFSIELQRGYKGYKRLPIVLLLLPEKIGYRNSKYVDMTACYRCYDCYRGKCKSGAGPSFQSAGRYLLIAAMG